MDKRYAIFDMDGTLIDSMGFWRNLGFEFLKSRGISCNFTKLSKEILPMTVSEAASLFVRRFGLKETPEIVARTMNDMMAEHYRKDIPLKKGISEHLEVLGAEGVRMCVVSATDGELVKDCLQRLNVFYRFDFSLSCEELNTHKREPYIFYEAAKRLKAEPQETAVYEDSLYAIETAKEAGFYVVAVYDCESASDWPKICGLADETIHFD